ncbi:hypothetical protein Hanom_Chr04g00377381 [Helianthus anomalus]
MILGHPDGVFSGQGERETFLAESAVVADLRFPKHPEEVYCNP